MSSSSETLPLFEHDDPSTMAPNTKKATAECISDEALIHLKSYKYSSVDKSPVSKYILGPWWNFFVELLPLWLAPNMVTLLGFFFILGNIGLLIIYMPDLVGPGPTWLYFSFAFGLFMYQTMDNVDGKQARRTGTSSGLGELFDHGIDSLNCTLASLLETAAMGLGTSPAGIFTALCPCLPMFFSTWETYHTHTLYLGVFNGPTEGLLIACGIMILSGIYGPSIYTQPLADIFGESLPGLREWLGKTTFRDIWVGIIVISLVARRKRNQPVLPVFLEWTPMAVFTICIGAWVFSPYSTLMRENHLILFCLTIPFPYWTVMLWPLVGGAIVGNLPLFGLPEISPVAELYYLWAYFAFALVVYFRWAYLVITSICNFLGINALTIPKDKQIANKQARDATKLH
ncbi:hypothetical protein ACCO45_006583 [Purpureocillium lilacinum]|uniref:Uncharacterized protein n=1 Tax=Purpureocillium lilacinum TaxID=33203 RepID=A0ACC4DSI7_PURLI